MSPPHSAGPDVFIKESLMSKDNPIQRKLKRNKKESSKVPEVKSESGPKKPLKTFFQWLKPYLWKLLIVKVPEWLGIWDDIF